MQNEQQPYTGRHERPQQPVYAQPVYPTLPARPAQPVQPGFPVQPGQLPAQPQRHGRGRFHMPRGRYDGRWWLIIGALLLLGMTAYEFSARLETIVRMIGGFRQAYTDLQLFELSGVPFTRYLVQAMLRTPDGMAVINIMIFLVACIAFSIICVCLRNRPMACYGLLIGDAALLTVGLILHIFYIDLINVVVMLKLIPIFMIMAGCLINIIQFYYRRHGYIRDMKQQNAQQLPGVPGLQYPQPFPSAPVDPQSAKKA